MSLKLLVKKLHLNESKFIVASELKNYCEKLNLDYYSAIGYLLSNNYLIRMLRGIFYVRSLEERKLNKADINYMEAIAESLKLKNINNWYFGLETALKLNKLTHEYFATDYIINDTLFRPKPIIILGHKIRFIKLKKSLFDFGIIKHNKISFSENEKTLLDLIYLSKYSGYRNIDIKNRISDLVKHCSKNKLIKYSKKYNKTIRNFVEEML
ncbi:MAG: hypothetical protein AABX33_02835 [Nanoarchaeota archaeon]